MKYTCSVVINVPVDKVVELWQDERYLKEWQDGYEKTELLEGTANTVGAKSKIYWQQGKRRMELLETILEMNLPAEKKGLYVHEHMTNTQISRFEKVNEQSTRYTSEVEYTQFNGFMPKLMARLFPGMFKKQSQKWMDQFKTFVENH